VQSCPTGGWGKGPGRWEAELDSLPASPLKSSATGKGMQGCHKSLLCGSKGGRDLRGRDAAMTYESAAAGMRPETCCTTVP